MLEKNLDYILKSVNQIALVMGLMIGVLPATYAADIKAAISHMGDATHLEFSGRETWDYELKKNSVKGKPTIEMTLTELSPESQKVLKSWKGPLIKSIEVSADGVDKKLLVRFYLEDDSVDSFDYLTDQPSRLIVDFFHAQTTSKDKPAADPKKDKSGKKAKVKKQATTKTEPVFEAKNSNRAPASDLLFDQSKLPDFLSIQQPDQKKTNGIFDGGDPNFERFSIQNYEISESAIIKSRENIYLPFPTLKMDSSHLKSLNAQPPVYEFLPKDTEENKEARLLQTLFNSKRHAVFLKTLEMFHKKYPKSDYDEMLSFMEADIYYDLWLKEQNADNYDIAMSKYAQAVLKYPKSPLVERTWMLMGFSALDRGDVLGTLRIFKQHLRERPQSQNRDAAQIAVAEAFLKINKYDDAVKTYEDIETSDSSKEAKTESAYLKGDVYFQKKDYEAAVNEYQKAFKKFPDDWMNFPNAFYNTAEALFWLGQYKKSLDGYRDYLRRFPSHSHAGYAMTRLGELLEILGADRSRVVGAYLETYFRYGDTPGASVARMRLLSQRMNTMKPKEVEQAVSEIQDISSKTPLVKMPEFAALMVAEGYSRRAEYEKAIKLLAQYYQANPTTSDTEILSQRIIKNISAEIRDYVDKGDFIQALKTHNQYADNWLKGSNRIDTVYCIGRAFEQAGVFSESEKVYLDVLKKLQAMRGTKAEKERSILEKLPTESEVYLRLANSAILQKKPIQAFEYMNKITDPTSLSEPLQIERVELAANIQEQKGDIESAKRYLKDLIGAWKGDPKLVASPYLKLAEYDVKSGKKDGAIESLNKIMDMKVAGQDVSDQVYSRSLELLGQLYLDTGKTAEAIKTFDNLLTNYEDKRPLSSVRYKLGDIYFNKGEIQKASDVWSNLKGQQNDVWYKLSQEKLKSSNWKDEYKKYIQRIPAMAEPAASKQ